MFAPPICPWSNERMTEEKRLPKYHETFTPILTVLDRDGDTSRRELRTKVRDEFYADLPEEELSKKTKMGDPLIFNRVGWGMAYLKQAKMVEQPERAMFRITDKGRGVLQRGELTLKELTNDPDFAAHRKSPRKNKGDNGGNESGEDSPEDLIDSGVTKIESQLKNELLDRLKTIDPHYFEKVILRLLYAMGYGDFVETSKSNDGGIDGVINQDHLGIDKIYIQAKRFSDNPVREKDIRNFIGAMSGDTTRGVFVTTSEFDNSAVQKVQEAHHTIIMIDGVQLVDLMVRHSVGVQVKNTYDVKEVDEDFFE